MRIKLKSFLCIALCVVATVFSSCGVTGTKQENQSNNADVDSIKVNYLDVGQGDSIFIELPNGKTMLIDASTKDYGEGIVEYIKDSGYDKLDYLVATHPHADHIGGMEEVVKSLDIGEIYMPKATTTTKTYKNLLLAIKDKGLSINTAKAGENIFSDDNLQINILAPNSDKYESLNNYSAVVKITYKNRKFLFMGDAEKLSEKEITADVSADILKVGHHGSSSSTSEEFLKKVNPSAAVISCGVDNSYGHPHSETLNILERFNIQIFRTDTMGTIIAESDGNSLDITKDNPSVEEK